MSKHLKGELSESTKNTYKTRLNKLIAYGYDVESMTISNIDTTYRKIVAIEKQWNGNKKSPLIGALLFMAVYNRITPLINLLFMAIILPPTVPL